jgi:hypothetical protein
MGVTVMTDENGTGWDGALFPTSVAAIGSGRAESALHRALQAGLADGTIRDVDEALGESALILARALDAADRIGGLKGGYLAAQAQPAFQKALHALRLPAELTPVPAPPPSNGPTDLSELLGDSFGRAE